MDPFSAELMVKALDALQARAAVTAENIANAGTPRYRPLRLDFEQALKAAAAQGPDAIRAFQPSVTRVPDDHLGSTLRVDLELATASTTALRYAALVDVLNREMQLNLLAIKGSI